jgi:hypothetical protein
MLLGTIIVKVDEYLKKRMSRVKINWSEYIRETIKRRVEIGEREEAAEKLIESLKVRKHDVSSGFINDTIRVMREVL